MTAPIFYIDAGGTMAQVLSHPRTEQQAADGYWLRRLKVVLAKSSRTVLDNERFSSVSRSRLCGRFNGRRCARLGVITRTVGP